MEALNLRSNTVFPHTGLNGVINQNQQEVRTRRWGFPSRALGSGP